MVRNTPAAQASRWIRVGLAAAAASVALAGGCKKGSDTASGGGGAKPVTLAFVTNNASDFWTYARAGTRKAMAETPGLTVDFEIPSHGEAADQKQVLQAMLAKGVDGVAISPVDPPHETEILNDVAKRAVLFCQDSDAPKTNRACYVGTDNIAAGRQAGEQLKLALPNGGKVMAFVGRKDAQNAHDRFQGLSEALAGSNITIVDEKTDEEDRMKAKQNVQEAIVNTPDVAGFVGLWSYNGPAIVAAVRDAKKIGQIKIVCFDEEAQTLAAVKAGEIECTIVQQPYEFGRMSMEIMAKVVRGDSSAIPPSKQIFVATKVITKGDVDAYTAKLAEEKAAGAQ
jgi:ribose transport system substrate-binding protein